MKVSQTIVFGMSSTDQKSVSDGSIVNKVPSKKDEPPSYEVAISDSPAPKVEQEDVQQLAKETFYRRIKTSFLHCCFIGFVSVFFLTFS